LRAVHLCLGLPGAQLASSIEPRDFTDPDKPLLLRVVLQDFDDDDRAAFPDEISTCGGESLTLEVEAVLGSDEEQLTVQRRFLEAGHERSPNKFQLARFRWAYVPAARSLYRELGPASGGVVRALLSTVELGDDQAAFDEAAEAFRRAIASSEALTSFRQDLANSLSEALPRSVTIDELGLTSQADLLEDPLTGVTLTVDDGGHPAPLAEQSDGIRALAVLTLLGMSHEGSHIVGIDEPETHLHHTAQRSISARLRLNVGQRIIVTHSPSIVREMDPLDIVVMGADRVARQLPLYAPLAEIEEVTRHWAPNIIEPLTARSVLLVEGPSDRILVDRVAHLVGIDLNRSGVSIFEMGGSGLFDRAYQIFGPPGFDVRLFGLLDEDARQEWAEALGVDPGDIESGGDYAVCQPDLEGLYVAALGGARVQELLLASPTISETSLLNACGGLTLDAISEPILGDYCRHKKRKIRAALAVAAGLTETEARALAPVLHLVVTAVQ
jgi:putative ATP-dependent endonuclease of OLD family